MAKAYERLKQVRASKTVSLKPSSRLKQEITSIGGGTERFDLRYYQVQGVYHMMTLKRMVLGDDCGLGKTVETLAAMAYLWDSKAEANHKVIVVAPKSAMNQWADEIKRFLVGVEPIVASAKPKKGKSALELRTEKYEKWRDAKGPTVLITNYALLVRDWNEGGFRPLKPNGKPDPNKPVKPGLLDKITEDVAKGNLTIIFDEATAFKSKRTKTWETAYFLSQRANRCYGLTATLLKNRLFEGYCIYGVVRPGLFTTQSKFYDQYCFVELKKVGKARIPLIKGYKNLDQFRATIDPFFLGRKKHMVAKELPTLTTKEIVVELSRPEEIKYAEALTGIFELGDGELKVYEDNKALVSLIYCQQVVNSLATLKFDEDSGVDDDLINDPKRYKVGSLGSKEQALVDLLSEQLEDQKVIVYTRFASLVPRLQAILKKAGVASTRITGMETDDKVRQKNQKMFQDPEGDVNVIFITDAGSEAINLQMAAATVFYDAPWSWGNYIQILGRMIRIGSPHKGVLVFHLVAARPGKKEAADSKTIDHHVLSLLRSKRGFIDKILGEGAVGALTFDKSGKDLHELVRLLQGPSK